MPPPPKKSSSVNLNADAELLAKEKELELVSSSLDRLDGCLARVGDAAAEYVDAIKELTTVYVVLATADRVRRPGVHDAVSRLEADLSKLGTSKSLQGLRTTLAKDMTKRSATLKPKIAAAQQSALKCAEPLKQYSKRRDAVLEKMPQNSRSNRPSSKGNSKSAAASSKSTSGKKKGFLGCGSEAATSTKSSAADQRRPSMQSHHSTAGLMENKDTRKLVEQMQEAQRALEAESKFFTANFDDVAVNSGVAAKHSVDHILRANIEAVEALTEVMRMTWKRFPLGKADAERRNKEEERRIEQEAANLKLRNTQVRSYNYGASAGLFPEAAPGPLTSAQISQQTPVPIAYSVGGSGGANGGGSLNNVFSPNQTINSSGSGGGLPQGQQGQMRHNSNNNNNNIRRRSGQSRSISSSSSSSGYGVNENFLEMAEDDDDDIGPRNRSHS